MVSLVLCNPSCGWSSHFHEYLRTCLMIRHYSPFLRVSWPTEPIFSGSHSSPPNSIYCYSFDSIVAPASNTVCPCWCLFKLQPRCFRTRCRWKYSSESTGSVQSPKKTIRDSKGSKGWISMNIYYIIRVPVSVSLTISKTNQCFSISAADLSLKKSNSCDPTIQNLQSHIDIA